MSEGWIEEAERIRARRPRSVVFLCVTNAARSQMAEAIALALAGPSVKVASAGARPSPVHPKAVEVLAELGIDISRNPSRSLAELPPEGADVVITLCDEDVGAALPGALRVHWPLPDPTAAAGSEAERLEVFRSVRDELMRRLSVVFDGPRMRRAP